MNFEQYRHTTTSVDTDHNLRVKLGRVQSTLYPSFSNVFVKLWCDLYTYLAVGVYSLARHPHTNPICPLKTVFLRYYKGLQVVSFCALSQYTHPS